MEDDHDARHDGPLERHCRQGTPPVTRRVYGIPVFFGVTTRSNAKHTIRYMAHKRSMNQSLDHSAWRSAAHRAGSSPPSRQPYDPGEPPARADRRR
jgi:hypothetical protein